MPVKMKRDVYAEMFGPTTGDRVRLADTDIIIEVEKDFTTYGEEVKFGGGKAYRDHAAERCAPMSATASTSKQCSGAAACSSTSASSKHLTQLESRFSQQPPVQPGYGQPGYGPTWGNRGGQRYRKGGLSGLFFSS